MKFDRRQVCRSLLALGLWPYGTASIAAPQAPREIILGVYPYLSPSQIVDLFSPLADHLSSALEMPVTLRSAPDFPSFIERTRAGEYDIIFTAPHMGRLAEKRDGYRPLAQSGNPFVFVVLVKKDSPVRSIADMRGRSIAIGAKLSMTYQVVERALAKEKLVLGKDVAFVDSAGFSNIVQAIHRGEAVAGAAPTILLDNAPAELRAGLREIYRSEPLPGFFLLGHARLSRDTAARLQTALFSFARTPQGKAYFAKTLQLDFRSVGAPVLKQMDSFTAVFDAP